eukprot:jgi/Pico_ML_1/52838/g3487.t1
MWRSARRASTLLVQHSRSMATSCEVEKFVDHHRNLMHLGKRYPLVAPDAYVAPNATVVGDVDLDDRVTVGYGAVLRGDLNNITIGAVSNIGDRTVIHTAREHAFEFLPYGTMYQELEKLRETPGAKKE